MKKLLVAAVAVGLVVTLVASEAWPGGARAGGRRGGGVAGRGSAAGGPLQPGGHGQKPPAIRPPQNEPLNPTQLGQQHPKFQQGTAQDRFPGFDPGPKARGAAPKSFEIWFRDRQQSAHEAAESWTSTHPEPFTPEWYLDHPNAWKATHPYAGMAVAATAAGLSAWLAAPYAAGGGTAVVDQTVIAVDELAAAEMPTEDEASLGEAPDDAAGQEWIQVGVYKLFAPGETEATRMMELAVARDGTLAGSQYDRIRNAIDPIHGRADRGTLLVEWRVGQGEAEFEATFDALMQPEAQIAVALPDGQTSRWQIQRVAR